MRRVTDHVSPRNPASLTAAEEAETNDAGHDSRCSCDGCLPEEHEHDVCPVAISGVAA